MTSTSLITLAQAMRDPMLLGQPFAAPTFWPWHAVAKLLSGEPFDSRETDLFHQCTGRSRLPTGPVGRLILLVGRRGGKDRFASAVAVHQAALAANWEDVLSPGEQAVVIMVGVDKRQARILRRYCAGLLSSPLIAAEVSRDTDEMIEFRNGAALEIVSNDAQLIRGRSAVAIIGTEACFWSSDETSASSDEEVVSAGEPSMAMTPGGGLLLMQSSVYRRHGYMFRRFRELHGNDESEEICWLATSQTMNPALPSKIVTAAMERDPQRAQAEFNSVWRDDIANYAPRALIEAAVDGGVAVRPRRDGIHYFGYIDAASGAGQDSFAACISHLDNDQVVVDALFERKPPFNPQDVTLEVSWLLKSYGVTSCVGDKYAAGYNIEDFARCGLEYTYCDKDTSQNYIESLALFTSGRVRLIDNPRLVNQFAALERRTSIAGRDRVNHPAGDRHDDLSAATAGAIVLASGLTETGGFNLQEYLQAYTQQNMWSFNSATRRQGYL